MTGVMGMTLTIQSYGTGSVCDAGQMFAESPAIAAVVQLLF